jgi:hypothetical protein
MLKTNKIKMPSFTHKYVCETCNYYTDLKNSYNKHIKTTKHLSLLPSSTPSKYSNEETIESENVEEVEEIVMNDLRVCDDVKSEVTTLEEINNESINEEEYEDYDYQLNEIVHLMENLNKSIKIDLRVKYFYFGLGFLFNFILFNMFLLHLFIGSQRSDFFEFSR